LFPRFLLASVLLIFFLNAAAQLKRYSFTQSKMASPFTIVMYCNDSATAVALADKSFYLVDSFVHIFTDYDSTSELMQLCAAAGSRQPVSADLMDILKRAKAAAEQTKGAFDITIGPLIKRWRKARKTKQFPLQQEIDSLKEYVGYQKMELDTINNTVLLTQKGMSLDLGGIAQGWIAQKVMNFLSSQHITSALVNASGDIVVSDAPPGATGWSVGINVPEEEDELLPRSLLLKNKSVTTSGDVFQFIEKDGKRYSHITDPKTGYGITSQRNVTVIAGNGTDADWLATACSILKVKKAKKLVKKLHAELLIAENKKGRIIFHSTKGFAQYWNQSISN